jgi:hypothetical protein
VDILLTSDMNAGLQLDKAALWAYTHLRALTPTRALQLLAKHKILPLLVEEMVIDQVIEHSSRCLIVELGARS